MWLIVFDFCVEFSFIPLRIEMTSSGEYCCPEIGCGMDILILYTLFLKYLSSSFDLLIVVFISGRCDVVEILGMIFLYYVVCRDGL